MAGKSPVRTTGEQRAELRRLASSPDRAEADRVNWTLPRLADEIGQAFGVREDTVRFGRGDFAWVGVAALKTYLPIEAFGGADLAFGFCGPAARIIVTKRSFR